MSFAHQSEASTSNFHSGATVQNSSKFRAYVSAVDKALKSFENTTEWADLIAALGKLGKVFSTNAKLFNEVPNSVTVAKRLSQCLHPALPSGVHLKALETYRQVFLILGRTENLPRYLYLFAIGLFPLMDHCGIKVKSELLNIFEQFLLPLGASLRPALPGFIAAVLLGLEEGTEFYGRSFQLLEQVMDKVGGESFYACFWQAVHGSSSIRLPALQFLNAKLEKRKPVADQMYIIAGGGYPNHMITALCAVAEDPGSTLIQRHLLDFLSSTFPMNGDNIPRDDLVQILQRSLFVVLRRDMSLNRRLYQWLLNRSNDGAFASLPLNGKEDVVDMNFFRAHSLPLIKLAVKDFLKVDVLELTPLANVIFGTSTLRPKEVQIQFAEVRLCRLLHYFLDRREVGILVLNETLSMFLEFVCQQDVELIVEFHAQCEELDSSFERLWNVPIIVDEQKKKKRVDESKKSFNSLLNSLEAGFLWQFLEEYFLRLVDEEPTEFDNSDCTMIEENGEVNSFHDEHATHLKFYPLIVAYCLKNVQLDSHGDIRGRYLSNLLLTVLNEIRRKGCDAFNIDIFVALLNMARRVLQEISQNVSMFEVDVVDQSSSMLEGSELVAKNQSSRLISGKREDCAEEQALVESCLSSCFSLLIDICEWYLNGRDRYKTGVLCTVSALVRDFADFPFYSFQTDINANEIPSIYSLLDHKDGSNNMASDKTKRSQQPEWLAHLIRVVDADSWMNEQREHRQVVDFDVRSRILDLVLYLYVRSSSVINQHLALAGRTQKESAYYSPASYSFLQRTTTTVLLKPFFSERDLSHLEANGIFRKTANVLWSCLANNTDTFCLQTAAFLLLRLHSRRVSHTSSEVEDIIVSELTSSDKVLSGSAAKKFRDLWVFCRSAAVEDVYSGVLLKPMNRVIMVLLGFIANDLVGTERIELRAIAYAWFIDCSRHNDLSKILQMLLLMLVNPATSRVSIQFVQIHSRITREELPSMPIIANAITLSTSSGKQKFHHVCRDIDVPLSSDRPQSTTSPWNNFSYIDCKSTEQWVIELSKLLLLSSSFDDNTRRLIANNSTPIASSMSFAAAASEKPSSAVNCHKRTISDIPQFDEDAESVGSLSLDSSLDHDIFQVIQFIVDTVVEEEIQLSETPDGGLRLSSVSSAAAFPMSTPPVRPTSLRDEKATATPSSPLTISKSEPGQETPAYETENDQLSVLNSNFAPSTRGVGDSISSRRCSILGNNNPAMTTGSLSGDASNNIKRIKCGHRRQDSLQESIFSTTTQELRLFDPSELPNSTCPGDTKQPLLDETHSHMLFYAENPRIVDLGRAEKIFRTIGALLKSGFSLGRHIVNCLIFTNTADFKKGCNSQLVDYMIRHYRHMQGGGFWEDDLNATDFNNMTLGGGNASVGGNVSSINSSNQPTIIPGSDKNRNPTLFEIFSTILLYYFRSYYLNSPTNYVSQEDLIMSWKCKIAALDCFTELLRILNDVVKEINSRDFVSFVQQIYRFTRTQRAVIALMLTAVPSPPTQKDWRMPITVDIAEFNNGPQENHQFRDLIFAYHRSLLNLSFSIVVLEYNMQMGVKNFTAQSLGLSFERIMENRQLYNSPANRSTIRDPRYMVVELRMFISVILNALKRCPERHELWLQFLISAIPYLDRALPTFAVHVVEQICRNIYECVLYTAENNGVRSPNQMMIEMADSPRSGVATSDFKTAFYFADFRVPKKEANADASTVFVLSSPARSGSVTSAAKYPANYAVTLMESLMSILHFCMIDSACVSMPFLIYKSGGTLNRSGHNSNSSGGGHSSYSHGSANHLSLLNYSVGGGVMVASAPSAMASSTGGGGGGGSSMSGLMGNAFSVIPGTNAITNLFGKVFTSGDSSGNHSNSASNVEMRGASSESWIVAQKELIKIFPSALAILCDVWSFVSNEIPLHSTAISNPETLVMLVMDTLNPLAKKHTNALINAFGVVWIARQRTSNGFSTVADALPQPSQPSISGKLDNNGAGGATTVGQMFVYSEQQRSIARLLLRLNVLYLNTIIASVTDILKESASRLSTKSSSSDKSSGFISEVALLELLHECTRQVSVEELQESWSALNVLFNETPLAVLPARASFLQFEILTDFVRRCGSKTIIEDRQISRSILDVCQKLTDAVNSIVGWQLESTTWLKRTLVVRQDAATLSSLSTSQKSNDISPTLDLKNSGGAIVGGGGIMMGSEASSMRGSTVSLVAPNNRLSSIDGASQFNGSSAQLSINSTDTSKKSMSNLRGSLKGDSMAHTNRRDPTDSTQALFLLAENLAELIDSISKSEDKEKLLPTLQAVWGNALPFLKAKSAKNVRFFLASSQFLASMSSFNYMRQVWKKSTMELLLDPSFFKMDIHALRQWLIVIDNLMTNDKISFKELLARITTGTSTTLSNLITSKEQEYEMRAQSLKRLAFVILSSELDQYSAQLNEIQERLSENLRLNQVPVVHAQVFVCYRVLLVRMRPSNFVSMWPSMVTELVQVLSQIEQQLQLSVSTNAATASASNVSNNNATIGSTGSGGGGSTTTSISNLALDDLKCSRDDHWMQLYLAACKLFETLCTLPCGYVAQFQMCRWAFVSALNTNSAIDVFVPFAVRINSLLNSRFSKLSPADREVRSASLFNIKTLTSFQELHPFFNALATQHAAPVNALMNSSGRASDSNNECVVGSDGQFRDANYITGSMTLRNAVGRIEQSLYVDFADHWQL